mgnify:CR=1 FL=1
MRDILLSHPCLILALLTLGYVYTWWNGYYRGRWREAARWEAYLAEKDREKETPHA